MKLLFDQNLGYKLCQHLSDLFPNSTQVRLVGLARAADSELWTHAAANGFALVTLDADFAEMAALLGPPPKVIWVRRGNQPSSAIATLLRRHAEAIAAFEQDAAACLEVY